MPTAFLQTTFGTPTIDAENGVITGVKIMEKGTTAHFADSKGNAHVVTISDNHINALLGFAGNRAVPIHKTHEWLQSEGKPNADSVEMDARIGALKNFRKNDGGDLIADAFLKDGSERQDILWLAKNNPENTMFSAVYNFKPEDKLCIPTNFRAGDIVPDGASVTALFSDNPNKPMPITLDDLKEVCSTPEGKEMLRSAIKGHDNAEDAAAAEMESDAGVTDADKKPEDDQKAALMRATLRCNRATVRIVKSLAVDKTALLAEVKTASAAEATALLGRAPFLANGVNMESRDKYTAMLTKYKETANGNELVAVRRMLSDHPDLSEAHEAAIRAKCERLANK